MAGKKSNLWIVIIAIAMVGVAVVVSKGEKKQTEKQFEARPLIEGLDLSTIAAIEVNDKDNHVRLNRLEEDEWGLDSRHNYPIDGERLRRGVLALAGLKVIDRMTENPDKYERLGVGNPPENGSVTLYGRGEKKIAEVILGNQRESANPSGFGGAQGQFLREADDPAVYLSDKPVSIDTNPTGWLQREVIKLPQNQLNRVEIYRDGASSESLVLTRVDALPFSLLTPVPAGMIEDTAKFRQITNALGSVSLQDVMSADEATSIGFDCVFRATQKNGVVVEATTGELDGKHYLKLWADYNESANWALSDQITSDTQTAQLMPEPQEACEEIQQRHGPWVYEVSQYIADNLRRGISDITKDPKAEAAEQQQMPTMPEGFSPQGLGGMPPPGLR